MKKTRFILPVLVLCMALFACVCFSGCLSSDYNTLTTKLQSEDYGYTVLSYTKEQMTNSEITGLSARVQASKMDGSDLEYVAVWYFETEEYAIRWYEKDPTGAVQYGLDTMGFPEDAAQANSGEYVNILNIVHSRQGKVVVAGTADAYADAMS